MGKKVNGEKKIRNLAISYSTLIMQTTTETQILIRVQAKDGMFLGPDSFGGAFITIKDQSSGKELANGFTDDGDSGSRQASYQPNSSPRPIIAPGTPPTLYWLTAEGSTVKFAATLGLTAPTLLEFTVKVPLPPEQGDQFFSVTQWVLPGNDLTVGPGLVIEIPGLWVQPEVIVIQDQVRIRAKVTMMCGCEINDNSPWLPGDFEVTATVTPKNGSGAGFPKTLPLEFEVNSQFVAELTMAQKGDYVVSIEGFQRSTANAGRAVMGFRVG